jgi:peroxiredoxin Q/BCP
LQSNLPSLTDKKIQVIALSYDSVNILDRFASKEKITFPLLSDPKSKIIHAYGIYNREADGTRLAGIPYPGTFIVDQKGVIRAKLFHEGYRSRHTSDDILKAVQDLE